MGVAVGQKTWLGTGKETTFNTAVAPTIFHGCESNSPVDKNGYTERPGPRGIGGRTLSAPGPISVSLSVKPEPDPDAVMQLIAYAMGVQATPAHPGISTVAYTSKLTIGNLRQLPSFTAEYFRDNDCVDMTGCCIDTMKISMPMSGKLGIDFGIVAAQSQIQASPATPTFSTLMPMTAEGPASTTTYNGTVIGVPGQIAVRGWDVSLANNLDKNYRTVGSQYVAGFPLGARKVGATLKAGFESNQQYLDFLAQGTIPLIFVASSSTVADAGATGGPLYYQMAISLPKCRITQYTNPQKTSGPQEQTISFEAYRDATGGHDDMEITLTNLASAVY